MRLLLETHLPAALAVQLRRRGFDAVTLQEWRGGLFRKALDPALLAAAHEDRRILVTFDTATIPPLLKVWGETGQRHAGVVLVSSRSFAPNDVGRLLHALVILRDQLGEAEWEDHVVFLVPA
jgi:hypothetical protein